MTQERASVEQIIKAIYGSLAKQPDQTIQDVVKDTGICWEVIERYMLILQAIHVVRARVKYSLKVNALTALQGSGRERMLTEFANFSEDKEKFLKQIESIANERANPKPENAFRKIVEGNKRAFDKLSEKECKPEKPKRTKDDDDMLGNSV